jgi:hypothetical protein
VGLLTGAESRSWPFTARAPFYWDQVFADELSDSFVRREFGRGAPAAAALPLGLISRPADKAARLLQKALAWSPLASRLKDAVGPIGAALFFLAIGAAGILTVSVAADPAAWINPAQTRVAETAPSTSLP